MEYNVQILEGKEEDSRYHDPHLIKSNFNNN